MSAEKDRRQAIREDLLAEYKHWMSITSNGFASAVLASTTLALEREDMDRHNEEVFRLRRG